MADCVFCAIRDGRLPATIIAQNDFCFVIKDRAPKAPIHYLIIPKEHVADIQSLTSQDGAVAGALLLMAQELSKTLAGTQAFRLVVNSGADAGQKVFHLHVHFLAGSVMTDF